MKKRTESNTVTAILKYLQILENLKRIKWCDRLNSGSIFAHGRKIRLCRVGTADVYCVLNNGKVIWFEVKDEKGTISDGQQEFRMWVDSTPNHTYAIVKQVDDVVKVLQLEGV